MAVNTLYSLPLSIYWDINEPLHGLDLAEPAVLARFRHAAIRPWPCLPGCHWTLWQGSACKTNNVLKPAHRLDTFLNPQVFIHTNLIVFISKGLNLSFTSDHKSPFLKQLSQIFASLFKHKTMQTTCLVKKGYNIFMKFPMHFLCSFNQSIILFRKRKK